ncbi:hypothetical protein LIER_14400 [Lithospermum erythrorhizon]|uniref:Uncharacterized protein n=1 Tax=Lithospermum erythrorhizon TaxID=34254 RepID=A0AAV3Q3N4_LITER
MGKTSKPTKKRARTQNPQTSNQLAIVESGSSSNQRPSANRNVFPARGGKCGRAGKPNILDGGFSSYANEVWPSDDEIVSFDRMTEVLNNGRRFRNGYQKRGLLDMIPRLHLYTMEARFTNTCVVKSLVPVGSQYWNLNKVVTSLTYKFLMGERINLPIFIAFHMRHSIGNHKATTLPYGMLITHTMESWGGDSLFPRGNPLIGKTHRVNKDYFKLLTIAYHNNLFYWKWEAKLANREDRKDILTMMDRKWFREVDDIEDPVFSDDNNNYDDGDDHEDNDD